MDDMLTKMPIIEGKNIFGEEENLDYFITELPLSDNFPYHLALKDAVNKTIRLKQIDETNENKYKYGLQETYKSWNVLRSIVVNAKNKLLEAKIYDILMKIDVDLALLGESESKVDEMPVVSASTSATVPLTPTMHKLSLSDMSDAFSDEEIPIDEIDQSINDVIISEQIIRNEKNMISKEELDKTLQSINFSELCYYVENISFVEESFNFLEVLGEGSFGKIIKTELTEANSKKLLEHKISIPAGIYAFKIINKVNDVDKIKNEINVHQKMSELSGMKFYACIELINNRLIFILEYIDGINLYDFSKLLKDNPLKFKLLLKLLISTGEAIYIFSMNKIAHRDIKPENIMVTKNKDHRIVIVDYGFACVGTETSTIGMCDRYGIGTRSFIDPYTKTHGANMISADWYSYVCILLDLVYNINLSTYDFDRKRRGATTLSSPYDDWQFIATELNRKYKKIYNNEINKTFTTIFKSVLVPSIKPSSRLDLRSIINLLKKLYEKI